MDERAETIGLPPANAGERGRKGDEPGGTALPRPLQEHLAQQLRAEYQLVADKPAFLGDPAIPPEFDRHIRRLDVQEKAHERGIEAVKAALDLDEEDGEAR